MSPFEIFISYTVMHGRQKRGWGDASPQWKNGRGRPSDLICSQIRFVNLKRRPRIQSNDDRLVGRSSTGASRTPREPNTPRASCRHPETLERRGRGDAGRHHLPERSPTGSVMTGERLHRHGGRQPGFRHERVARGRGGAAGHGADRRTQLAPRGR